MKIEAIKIGLTINFSLGGKLYKKNCANAEECNAIFSTILKAKENPTPKNIKKIRTALNENTRVAIMLGIEADPYTGDAYIAGLNTPIPKTLLDVMLEYHREGFPMDAIINFWKLLMTNPDKRTHTTAFDFIKKHDFVLTTKGYMVVYKMVKYIDETVETVDAKFKTLESKPTELSFAEYVTNKYLQVKNKWKSAPNNYFVYRKEGVEGYDCKEISSVENYSKEKKDAITILGKLGDLYNTVLKSAKANAAPTPEAVALEKKTRYTDWYSQQMSIELGVPCKKDRVLCDADPLRDCSNGLHVGATSYVETFINNHSKGDTAILVCLVNPANIVAVPNYDHSKMRVSEYFPIAL